MNNKYFVIIVHQKGAEPWLLHDRQEMIYTFDDIEDAKRQIIRFWRENKMLSPDVLKMTIATLED
jgi:hypothetical protein